MAPFYLWMSWLQGEWVGICLNKAKWILQETVFSLTLKIFPLQGKTEHFEAYVINVHLNWQEDESPIKWEAIKSYIAC